MDHAKIARDLNLVRERLSAMKHGLSSTMRLCMPNALLAMRENSESNEACFVAIIAAFDTARMYEIVLRGYLPPILARLPLLRLRASCSFINSL